MDAGLDQHEGQHRRGGGLAVGAGHGDAAPQGGHRGQHLGPATARGCPGGGPPRPRGCPSATAGDTVTRSAAPTWAASWPTTTAMPGAARRSVTGEAFRSLPVTVWPMAASTVAMALMPAPPTPTTWMVERAGSGPRGRTPAGRSRRQPTLGGGPPRASASTTSAPAAAASGRPSARGGPAHGGQPRRVGQQAVEHGGQPAPVAVGVGAPARRPRPARATRALAVWWSPARRAGARGWTAPRPRPARPRSWPRPGTPPRRRRRRAGPSAPRTGPGPVAEAGIAVGRRRRAGGGRHRRPSPAARPRGRWRVAPVGPAPARPTAASLMRPGAERSPEHGHRGPVLGQARAPRRAGGRSPGPRSDGGDLGRGPGRRSRRPGAAGCPPSPPRWPGRTDRTAGWPPRARRPH